MKLLIENVDSGYQGYVDWPDDVAEMAHKALNMPSTRYISNKLRELNASEQKEIGEIVEKQLQKDKVRKQKQLEMSKKKLLQADEETRRVVYEELKKEFEHENSI